MVANGVNGWSLEDYDWDQETGIGKLTYERERVDTGEIEERVVMKAQPAHPKHTGWYMLKRFV